MKQKLFFIAAAALISGSAIAQSAFEGFYGQLGIGYSTNSYASSGGSNGTWPVISGTTVSYVNWPQSSSASSQGGFAGTATLGFNAMVDKDFLLGAGVEYSLPSAKSNVTVTNVSGPNTPSGNGGQWNTRNTYNLFVTPGLVINKDSLAYLKLGYTGTQIYGSSSDGNGSQNLYGYSLGAGYKQIISGNIYGFAELNYFKYNTYSDGSGASLGVSSTNALVGLGYKF
jgi:hypothetical protein